MRHYAVSVSRWLKMRGARIITAMFLITLLIRPISLRAEEQSGDMLTFTPTSATNTSSTPHDPHIHLETMEIPAILTTGIPFSIASTWSKDAAANADWWEVVYQLRSNDRISTEFVSSYDLSTAFASTTYRIEDEFPLDVAVPAGSYTVSVVLRDPAGEQSDLPAAIGGVLPSGRYADLGIVTVQPAVTTYLTVRDSSATMVADGTPRAEPATRTIRAMADTYVKQDKPNETFAHLLHTRIVRDSIVTLLRFDVTGLADATVTAATLRLSIMDGATNANLKVFAIDGDWNERTATWQNRPALGAPIAALPAARITRNTWIDIPLGQAITGNGTYNFALTTDSREDVGFRSASTRSPPALVLQLQGVAAAPMPSPPTANGQVIFVPKQLSMDAPELVNPLRGLYQWNGQEYAPQPIPARDAYGRFTWRDLEPTQGDYRFAALEAAIARAAREGRKYSFRVRTVVSTRGSSIPDYAMGGNGWWADYNRDGTQDTYVPDWNDPTFLRRAETFMQALGTRYDGDPRIAFVDIGLYGNWGEWHMATFGYPSATGAQRATNATLYRLVDMHITAFLTTPLVMLTDNTDALVYAMRQSPRIGWRRDSLGWSTDHFAKIEQDAARWNAIKDRWKTALVVTEFVNPRFQADPDVYIKALEEIESYHVSLVSNANTLKWTSLSDAGKHAFIQLGKTAGYRLTLTDLMLPSTVAPGTAFAITTHWANRGVAPVYEPWQVQVQLRPTGSDTVVGEASSGIDLTTVLPDHPIMQTDTVTLPRNSASGNYDVVVIVRDPRQTRVPLALALAGVQADGSYRVGTVRVP